MVQQELSFFWPLTEQIPLDLDFKRCEEYLERKRKEDQYTGYRFDQWGTNGTYLMSTGSTNTYISGNLSIDTDSVTFKTSKKPNVLQSMLYKVMGIKLEKK